MDPAATDGAIYCLYEVYKSSSTYGQRKFQSEKRKEKGKEGSKEIA
jgi:hypothetical protein